jgi:general secretion pathway protein C
MELLLEIFSRYSQKLALVSTIILVILITLATADMAIFVLDQMNQPAVIEPVGSGTAVTRSNRTALPSYNIARLNLFGEVSVKEEALPVDAPETKLNLELQGVFTSETAERSSAIVAQIGKEGILYYPGDRLPGNAVLTGVYDDHILLKRGTRVESLKFSDDAFRSPGASASGTGRSNSRAAIPGQQGDPVQASLKKPSRQTTRNSSALKSGNRKSSISSAASLSDFVTNNRKRIEQDPAALLEDLGVTSVTSGQSEGYQLSGELPDAILRRSGLQRGDTILSVNGQPVGNVMQDSALIDAAMAEGRVRVEVQRSDRRFFVTVPVR